MLARDMRRSGEELADAFARGVMEQGVDVVDLGLASTDLLYYASGALNAPGVMLTASHNPAQYNGFKLCLPGARPVGIDSGLAEIKATADAVLDGAGPRPANAAGSLSSRRIIDQYVEHVLLVRRRGIDPPAQDRRRHRQRHGRSRRARRVRAPADDRARGHVRRARRHLPQPPGRPAATGQSA